MQLAPYVDGVSSTISLSAEELRILQAAAGRRLTRNQAGRWVIDGEPRPQRAARQRLHDLRLIDWDFGDPGDPLRLVTTSAGDDLLTGQRPA